MFYPTMTVSDFCSLYIEDTDDATIWGLEANEEIACGTIRELMYCEYSSEIVQSYGIENGILCLNI
jgi:hypothetical protein